MYKIELYEKTNGKVPAREFILDCDRKLQAKILSYMDQLEESGPLLGMPYVRYLEDGIYELRVQSRDNNIRMFYFYYRDKEIIVTHGIKKKTQKTPRRELERAKKYREDYERRNNE